MPPHLHDERLECEILKKLLSDRVDGEMFAVVEVWVAGVRDGGGLAVLVVQVEPVLTVDSLGEEERERERERGQEREKLWGRGERERIGLVSNHTMSWYIPW